MRKNFKKKTIENLYFLFILNEIVYFLQMSQKNSIIFIKYKKKYIIVQNIPHIKQFEQEIQREDKRIPKNNRQTAFLTQFCLSSF